MAIGSTGWIGLGLETTPGTATASVNIFLPTEQYTAVQSHEPIELAGNIASLSPMGYLQGKLTPQGSATFPMSVETAEVLLYALGQADVVDNGDGTYTWTLTPSATLPTFTIHADEVIDKVEQAGAKLNKLTLSASAGEVLKADIEWLALTHNEGVALIETPIFPSQYLTFATATITINGTTNINVEALEVSIENSIEAFHTLRSSRYPAKVERNGKIKVGGKLTLIDWDSNLYSKMINADKVSLYVKFSDANGYYIEVTLPEIQFGGGFEPAIGTDRITAEPEFIATGSIPITIKVYTDRAIG